MKNMICSAVRSGAVTKSDSTVLDYRRLWVGGAGNVVIQHKGTDSQTTFTGVLAGTYLDVEGDRVMAATTATNIVWLSW